MIDNKGLISIFDGFMAFFLFLILLLIFTSLLTVSYNTYSVTADDSIKSQDIMESLSTKVNYTDSSFLEEITLILQKNNNSDKSIKEVSKMVKNKININKSFVFKETNVINRVLVDSGDYAQGDDYTVASRNCKNYSYTLIIYN